MSKWFGGVFILITMVGFQNCGAKQAAGLRSSIDSTQEGVQGDSNTGSSKDASGKETSGDGPVPLSQAIEMINNNTVDGAGRVDMIHFGYGFDGLVEPSLVLDMQTAQLKSIEGEIIEVLGNEVFSDIAFIITRNRLNRSSVQMTCSDQDRRQPAFAILSMGDGQTITLNRAIMSCGQIDFLLENGENAGLFDILRDIFNSL